MIQHLTQQVLPFWLKNAIDEEEGGIFTQLDRKGNIYGTEKSVWFQGRALYIFASAHNYGLTGYGYLDAAKKIYEFLPKCTSESGRIPFTVTREGKEIQMRRYYFSETFAAIGCAEYYLATGDEQAKQKAEMYFDVAYRLFTGADKTEPKFNPENHPYKGLSPAMIMLATAQVMRKLDKEKYDPMAKAAVKEIRTHWTGKGLLENIGLDGQFMDTPTGRLVNPGHSLEAAWFLMTEGVYQNNASLKQFGKDIIDISMHLGLVDGGIISFCDCDGHPAIALEWDMKLWWPQCEAMIANLLAYKLFGEQKYLDWYNIVKNYTFEKFVDKEYGEWYGYLHYDGTVANELKGNIFKGPFHIPRMLMLIDKIEKGEYFLF